MNRRPLRVRALAVLALLLAVAGCSGSPAAQKAKATTKSSAQPSPGTGSGTGGAAKDITIGIDVPFHPIWDYVQANAGTYFAHKSYQVHFKVLDATTQVPAFGKGDLQVITTVPSFMPIVKKQYGFDTSYIFPLARWTSARRSW
jgi:hypothetical protein